MHAPCSILMSNVHVLCLLAVFTEQSYRALLMCRDRDITCSDHDTSRAGIVTSRAVFIGNGYMQ